MSLAAGREAVEEMRRAELVWVRAAGAAIWIGKTMTCQAREFLAGHTSEATQAKSMDDLLNELGLLRDEGRLSRAEVGVVFDGHAALRELALDLIRQAAMPPPAGGDQ
jgi:hypothetical protein